MKKLLWFTKTNINHIVKNESSFHYINKTMDLTEFINPFIKNELWNKVKYRNEYIEPFEKVDLEKIKSLKIHLHYNDYPYSNFHRYENLIKEYVGENNIEKEKIISSGIGEASNIAVIEAQYKSSKKLIKNLTYEEQKNPDIVFRNFKNEDNLTWSEQNKIKSIICEFMQFFMFNLHLNFLTKDYDFNFSQIPNPIGFITILENNNLYYETDKIDFLSHYILWEEGNEQLKNIIVETSKFWCNYIPSIHFFLDALKGNFVTSSSFIKLVFTLESFFSTNSSNDFMTLVAPLVISNTVNHMKESRKILKKSFCLRNEIVHGAKVHNMRENKEMTDLFFELKNLIIRIFNFMIKNNLYTGKQNPKLNHELIFSLLTNKIAS